MICPLHDQDGNPRTLVTIEFGDLTQLEEIEEGYAVEYKSTWNDAVKAKLQKIITSFANANGGWLFVGINNDGSYAGISRNRTDFDQTIAQTVHHHITPIPRFETRYVEEPGSDKGVLVVEIPEGLEPPYVADGSVYVRVGSSSEKFISKADSYVLIDLHRKARRNREELEEFCHRTVYFPASWFNGVESECNLPILDVYLKQLHSIPRPYIPFAEFDETEDILLGLIKEAGLENFICQHAHHSLFFRANFGNNVDDVSPVIELFYDGSIKINLPLSLIQPPRDEAAIEQLQRIRAIRNTNILRVIDGETSRNMVMFTCLAVDKYITAKQRDLSDYAISYEFENMQGAVLKFDTRAYEDYAHARGFPYFGSINERTQPLITQRDDEGGDMQLTAAVWMRFLEGFGLPMATTHEDLRRTVYEIIGLHNTEEGEE